MKRTGFLFALAVFMIAGCVKPNTPSGEEREVVIYFATKSLTSSSMSTAAEDDIRNLLLFGVDDQNKVKKYSAINKPSSSGTTLTISNNTESLYAIANPSSELESANPSTLSDLTALTSDFSSAPQSPFLMGGMASIVNETVHIELVRAVAKIKFIGENDFQIASVTVMNTSSKGYVFQKTPFSVPTGKTDYQSIVSSEPLFYVAENTTVSPTKFIVSGQVNGKEANYTIEQLTTNGGTTPVNIVRNNYYEVFVTPKTESNCSITISILDWVDVPVDGHTIPDENFE